MQASPIMIVTFLSVGIDTVMLWGSEATATLDDGRWATLPTFRTILRLTKLMLIALCPNHPPCNSMLVINASPCTSSTFAFIVKYASLAVAEPGTRRSSTTPTCVKSNRSPFMLIMCGSPPALGFASCPSTVMCLAMVAKFLSARHCCSLTGVMSPCKLSAAKASHALAECWLVVALSAAALSASSAAPAAISPPSILMPSSLWMNDRNSSISITPSLL
mmetsp:Transcript_49255/g.137998  ORF Transcript_49255/g.137998 Transcript_49255/m.137998 type:complete len:219 (+) Transcript_49255:449-1105(+)